MGAADLARLCANLFHLCDPTMMSPQPKSNHPPTAHYLNAPLPLAAPGSNPGEARKSEPKFLSGWVLLAVAPFGVVQALATISAPGGRESAAAIGAGMGRALWGMVAAALVAWVVWRLARRPRFLAPIIFVTMYAIMTLSAVSATFGMSHGAGSAFGVSPSARDAQMKLKAASDNWAATGAF
jgi:hypothetical protein